MPTDTIALDWHFRTEAFDLGEEKRNQIMGFLTEWIMVKVGDDYQKVPEVLRPLRGWWWNLEPLPVGAKLRYRTRNLQRGVHFDIFVEIKLHERRKRQRVSTEIVSPVQ